MLLDLLPAFDFGQVNGRLRLVAIFTLVRHVTLPKKPASDLCAIVLTSVRQINREVRRAGFVAGVESFGRLKESLNCGLRPMNKLAFHPRVDGHPSSLIDLCVRIQTRVAESATIYHSAFTTDVTHGTWFSNTPPADSVTGRGSLFSGQATPGCRFCTRIPSVLVLFSWKIGCDDVV